jgi:hypothetical protein
MINKLENLSEQLIKIRSTVFVDNRDISTLVERSIRNRNLYFLLLESMDSTDIQAVKSVFNGCKAVLDDYSAVIKSLSPPPKYLVDLLKRLDDRLVKRIQEFEKAKKSDDLNTIIKYKDSVSDTGILIVTALRSLRNSITATSELIKKLGEDAFKPVVDDETDTAESDQLKTFEKLIGKAMSNRSLGATLKDENLEEFVDVLSSKIEKPSQKFFQLTKFFKTIKDKNLKIDSEKLIASILSLTPEQLTTFNDKIKSLDAGIKQAADTAVETSDELQKQPGETEKPKESEEGAKIGKGKESEEESKLQIDDLKTGELYLQLSPKRNKESFVMFRSVKDKENNLISVKRVLIDKQIAVDDKEFIIPLKQLVRKVDPNVVIKKFMQANEHVSKNKKLVLYETAKKLIHRKSTALIRNELINRQEIDTIERWKKLAGL